MLPSRISFGITFVSGIFQEDQRHSDLSIYMSTVMKSAKTEHIQASSRIARQSKAVDCCDSALQSWTTVIGQICTMELSLNRTCPTLTPRHRSN